MEKKLVDVYGREINYLRLSVTEKCNLSCFYCRSNPAECGVDEGKQLLSVDDYRAIGQAAVELGIRRIRLTGGEPLLRNDIVNIVRVLARIPALNDLSLTTNGVLLPELAFPLAEAGLQRVNISLDSLDDANFSQITNGGKLERVLKGIERSIEAGLTPLKINMVLLKGINDHEIHQFVDLTREQDLDVRFIEYMPICAQQNSWSSHFIALEEAKQAIGSSAELIPVEGEHGGGPARYYRLEGARGKIGFISPLSRHFCDRCNRLRVTFDGRLKPCLFSEEEVDLRPSLSPPDVEQLKAKFLEALTLRTNPGDASTAPDERGQQFKGKRSMTEIGG